ncbi:MAG: D-alanyl-D-alanine carboxypeptidase family protein [Patescibacteria group bacterium]
MIVKSLIFVSILLNTVGLGGISDRIDRAIIVKETNPTNIAVASDIDISLPQILARPKVKFGAEKPLIYASEYILVDNDSGKILLKEGIKNRVPIASTTKIMTAIVSLENYKLDDTVTISETASSQVGADTFIRPGEQVKVGELLKGLLIKSGNDTAYALAEKMNGYGDIGITRFVDKMNEKAKELGMMDTRYEDPAGLDTTGYSSAYDLYLAASHALKNETFAAIVKTKQDAFTNIDSTIWHEVTNSNRLVADYNYMGAIGVKTGYMPEAGHVLVSAAKRDDHTLIGVIIRTTADNATASADESIKLLDWGWQNVEWSSTLN